MMLLKQGALNIQMFRLGCSFFPPVKNSGYAPVLNRHSHIQLTTEQSS